MGVNELESCRFPSFEEGSLRPSTNVALPQTGRSGGGQTLRAFDLPGRADGLR